MDCNPAVLVGKKPRRLAAQESPRCGGGAVTCTSAEEFQPRVVEEFQPRVKKEKKGLGAPFWLAVLADAGRTGSASSPGGEDAADGPEVRGCCSHGSGSSGRSVQRGTKAPALPTEKTWGNMIC